MEKIDRSKMFGVGASDVPTILGINPFCTPLQLYSRLIGITEPGEQTEPQYWGKKKEQIIAERFAEDHGVKLMAYKKRFVHKTMPFFSCELDRIIVGTDTNVECKSVNEYKLKDWAGDEDQMPAYIIVQTQAQMGLSGRVETWVACLIGASNYMEKLVKFDAELYADIEKKVSEFWHMVENKIPPVAMIGDDDILLAMHPKSNEQMQTIQEMETAVARRQELSQQIKELTEEKETIDVSIKEAVGDFAGFKTEKYLIKWTPTETSRLDTEALKASGNYEKYCKTTTSRRLTIKLNKSEGK